MDVREYAFRANAVRKADSKSPRLAVQRNQGEKRESAEIAVFGEQAFHSVLPAQRGYLSVEGKVPGGLAR